MFVYLSIMVGAYIFTRMFAAGIRNYPNDDKFTSNVIKILSLITALVAAACVVLIFYQSATTTLPDFFKQ